MSPYEVRPGPFRRSVGWRLADGHLVEARLGKAERVWPLAGLRRLRLAPGTNRYLPEEVVMRLSFRRGVVSIGSHSFHRLGEYENHAAAFTAFVRALCADAARLAPKARFETGAAPLAGIFLTAMTLLAIGVVLLLLVALSAGTHGLGVDLAARLAFALLLMLAAQPWIAGLGVRRFDPIAVPAELITGRRP